MTSAPEKSLIQRLTEHQEDLTPKGRQLAEYIRLHPREAVFMRTRGLAEACGVSEATVVRFVGQLGYEGYSDFIQALRDMIDAEMTLLERVELTEVNGREAKRLGRVIVQEIDNLKQLIKKIDLEGIRAAVDRLVEAEAIYVIGSRLSYTFAYYMGWSLTKVRSGVRILPGSDSTVIDWLCAAPPKSLVVVIATSRYPNELIRLAKVVRRMDHELLVIADSALCPLCQFADLTLVAPCRQFPIIGSPSTIACLINCLVYEMISRGGPAVKAHEERLEQAYLENDILFNLERRIP